MYNFHLIFIIFIFIFIFVSLLVNWVIVVIIFILSIVVTRLLVVSVVVAVVCLRRPAITRLLVVSMVVGVLLLSALFIIIVIVFLVIILIAHSIRRGISRILWHIGRIVVVAGAWEIIVPVGNIIKALVVGHGTDLGDGSRLLFHLLVGITKTLVFHTRLGHSSKLSCPLGS